MEVPCTPPRAPSTPSHVRVGSLKNYTFAPPPTPRSSAARELISRHALQAATTLTISSFTALLADLTASQYSPTSSLFGSSTGGNERTRLDRIEAFREDYMIGALQSDSPPPLPELDAFSDGTRASLAGTETSVTTFFTADEEEQEDRLPISLVQRGVLAEESIKRSLRQSRQLIVHSSFASIAAAARRAMKKALKSGKETFVSCGLLKSPSWAEEYEVRGWAPPGIRFGNFKPDLIKFFKKEKGGKEGEVVWEVIEIKYSSNSKEIIYASHKVQAIYYHLCLLKLFSPVPLLTPSHRASIWISQDPFSSTYSEKPLALRTNLAFVEHHLFELLPKWLHAITKEEWVGSEEKRKAIEEMKKTATARRTPGSTLMDRFQAVTSPLASASPSLRGPAVWKASTSTSKPRTIAGEEKSLWDLPPLPDEDDEDLVEMMGDLVV
ncbi:hypothetical protein MNV49_002204 [Pseudohyphozyma bogoriensis]|nr:hypothetical protein MNV49_002204 [Pseudohyphozyma bogoriensis]